MMAAIFDSLFGLVCHQMVDRSPAAGDDVFPLCFRCAGFYLGMFSAYLSLLATGGVRRRVPSVGRAIILASLMVPFLVDGWASWLSVWSSPASIRAATGLSAGICLPMLFSSAWPSVGSALAGSREVCLAAAMGSVLVLLVGTAGGAVTFQAISLAAAIGLSAFGVNLLSVLRRK